MTRNVLITGGNRGLGRGLVEAYLSKPDTHVFATVRDPASASKSLDEISKASGSALTILKLEAGDEKDYPALAEALSQEHNVKTLDLVIANAAIAKVVPTVLDLRLEDLREHLEVNVSGPILLFQNLHPILAPGAKFIPISSSAGSLSAQDEVPIPNGVYGTSKAALNYITRNMHFQHGNLVIFPLHPGFVRTDMGLRGIETFGLQDRLEELTISVETSVEGMVKLIESATREEHSGKFWKWNGEQVAW